jgi:hypothetical protein
MKIWSFSIETKTKYVLNSQKFSAPCRLVELLLSFREQEFGERQTIETLKFKVKKENLKELRDQHFD